MDVPDSWPLTEEEIPRLTAPLFPLSNVWLFPGHVMPLHIFEPRYRAMVEHCLDGPGRIVLGTVQQGFEGEMPGAPPVYPIAGLGEIGRHDRLPDGRFLVMLVGLCRVRVREVESEHDFRLVEAEPIRETVVAKTDKEPLRSNLIEAIEARTKGPVEIPKKAPVGHLADFLLLRLNLPHELRNQLYSEPVVVDRAKRALAEHRRLPIVQEPSEDDADE